MKRSIRSSAFLLVPGVSCSRGYIQKIKREGYTDLSPYLVVSQDVYTGQGFSWEQVCQLAEWATEFGLGLKLFTGYMKYREEFLREHPERRMVCLRVTGGAGAPVERNWRCPFQPENKAEYVDLLSRVVQLPPLREIHLNDEASIGFPDGSIGCYCDYCVSEFERKFGSPPPRKADWASEVWWDWIQHRMESWTEVHAYFRSEVKRQRPDVAVGIQLNASTVAAFAHNPWLVGIDLAHDAQMQDVLATNAYHHTQYPRWTYRPIRRILTEAVRTTGGAALQRSMNIYPSAFFIPQTCLELNHQDGFFAGTVPFALGAETVTFLSHEMMELLPPGFRDGFQQARALGPYFEKTRPYSYATVINPSQTEIYGYPERNWGREVLTQWADVMQHVGLPWRWVFDRRLLDVAGELSGPVILPEAHCLTKSQKDILKAYVESGGGVLWMGRTPVADWAGRGGCPPPAGETLAPAELKPIRSTHPLLEGVISPLFLASAFLEPGIEGETVLEVAGRPALVVKEKGNGREAWIVGAPVYNYTRPGDPPGARTPTGGLRLLQNLLRWLGREEPMACLWPFPPDNAYRKLRPWDGRESPTMELFPMLGDCSLVCLIFNYVGLAYWTNLVMCLPQSTRPVSLVDTYTGKDLLSSAKVKGQQVTLPVEMPVDKGFLAVELRWK